MNELELAQFRQDLTVNPQMAIARVMGQPFDPRVPFTSLISAVCDVETVDGRDYTYYHSALLPTNKVIVTNAATGTLSETAVSPQTPTVLTFSPYNTENFYITLTALLDAKEDTIARKKKDIEVSMNLNEEWLVMNTLQTLAGDAGNDVYYDSGTARYTYKVFIDQLEQVRDYGSNFTLIKGSTIQSDMLKWDWDDNKNVSIYQAYNRLNVTEIDVPLAAKVTRDSTVKQVVEADNAFLVARDSNIPAPVLFVRQQMTPVQGLPSVIMEQGERPQRAIISGGVPINNGTNNLLAYSLVGFEQLVVAGINKYAVSAYSAT